MTRRREAGEPLDVIDLMVREARKYRGLEEADYLLDRYDDGEDEPDADEDE